jgi:hypothetical protein
LAGNRLVTTASLYSLYIIGILFWTTGSRQAGAVRRHRHGPAVAACRFCPHTRCTFSLYAIPLSGPALLLAPDVHLLLRAQVALGYKQLHNKDIEKIPIPLLQKNGFLFIWVINARYAFALDLMEKWGYRLALKQHHLLLHQRINVPSFSHRLPLPLRLHACRFVDDIAWVKATVNRRMAKGHGFYLQHAKETCLVGLKVSLPYPRAPAGREGLTGECVLQRARTHPTREAIGARTSSSASGGGRARSRRRSTTSWSHWCPTVRAGPCPLFC